MIKFKKILLPIDFSHVSPVLAPYAKTMAEKFDAEVHLLFVARDLSDFVQIHVSPDSVERCQTELVKGAEKRMHEFVHTHFSDYPRVRTAVTAGDATEKILEYAGREGIDLVVLGTHGRKGMERSIFGSVAERVVMRSPLPVLVVNPYKAQIEPKGRGES